MADAEELNERLGPDNVRTELYKLPPYTARRFAGLSITEEKIETSVDLPDDRVPQNSSIEHAPKLLPSGYGG